MASWYNFGVIKTAQNQKDRSRSCSLFVINFNASVLGLRTTFPLIMKYKLWHLFEFDIIQDLTLGSKTGPIRRFQIVFQDC